MIVMEICQAFEKLPCIRDHNLISECSIFPKQIGYWATFENGKLHSVGHNLSKIPVRCLFTFPWPDYWCSCPCSLWESVSTVSINGKYKRSSQSYATTREISQKLSLVDTWYFQSFKMLYFDPYATFQPPQKLLRGTAVVFFQYNWQLWIYCFCMVLNPLKLVSSELIFQKKKQQRSQRAKSGLKA